MKFLFHRAQRLLLASAVLFASFCVAGPVKAATVTGTYGRLTWTSTDGATATITGCTSACPYKVLNVPSTVRDIGGNTYSVTGFNGLGSNSVEKISFPDSVTSIPAYTLGNFTTIIFGSGINSIPIQNCCANLAVVKFKGNAPTVDYRVFNSATAAYRLAIGTGFGNSSTWRPAVSEGATLSLAEWQLEAPTAPTDLAVTLGSRSASISFTDAFNNGSEIARYEYSLNNGVTWITTTPSAPLGPIVLGGLTVGTTYSVKLRAINNVGASASSDVVTFVGSDVPNAPTNVGMHIDDSEWLYISFDKVVDNGNPITNFQYSLNNGGTWTTANTTQSPIVVRFVPDSSSYSVKVRAVNVVGVGPSSETVTTQTRSESKTGTFGRLTWRSIDGVTAMITGCTSPDWRDPCPYKVLNIPGTVNDADGKSYRVTRIANYGVPAGLLEKVNIPDSVSSIGSNAFGSAKLTTVTFGSGLALLSYAFSNKANLTTVRFKGNAPVVDYRTFDSTQKAYRLAGATGFGDGSTWRPAVSEGDTLNVAEWQLEAPTAPTDLVATLGVRSVSIAFTEAFNNASEITRYEYTMNNGGTWTTLNQSDYLMPIVLTGLALKTTYSFKLRAVNNVGVGASSETLTFVARDVPNAPVISSAIWDGWLSVNFTDGDNNGSAITGYEYSVDNGTTWLSRIYGDPIVTSPFLIPPPGDETTYVLKVRAVNAMGTGASSSSLTVRKRSEPVTGIYGRLNWSSWDGVSATITGCTENSCPIAVNIPSTVKGNNGTVYRVTRINNNAFFFASSEKLSIPDSVVTIGNAFAYSELNTISIGNGVREMVGSFPAVQKLQRVMFKGNAPLYPEWTFRESGNFTAYRLTGATGFGNGSTWSDGNRTINVATYELTAPEAPTDLVIEPAASSTLSVSFADGFNNGSEISGYEYSVNNGVTWATAVQPVEYGPIVITGLTNGVTYQVKLRALNVVGAGVGSAAVAGRPESVPSAPTNVVVTRGNRSLSISFSTEAVALEKITNYEYSIDNGVTWVTLDPAAVSSPIVINDLTNGTRYQVKLRAVNTMGVGASSVAVVGRPATVPSAPTNLMVTPSDASLSVSFTAGAINGEEITNYEYSINDGATWVTASPSLVSGPVVIRGLANGTSYVVKLRAVNAVGSGASSAGVSGRPVAVPSAPTNVVVARGGDQSLSVAFTPAAPNGEVVTNYEYSINDGASWVAASPSAVAGPIVIGGLTNGTRYPVKLRAVNAVGKGAASAALIGRPAIAPAAPTNLVVTRDDASLSISFTAGANNGEELIRYQYSIDNGTTWAKIPGGDVKSPVLVSGLTNGTTYSVLLRAVNDVGGGASSEAVTGKPREPLLFDSAGKDVPIKNDPAPTVAAKSDMAINGTKIYISLVPPEVTAANKARVTYYQYILKPTKKGVPVIKQTYRLKPTGVTTAILTGKPKTTYSVTVIAITSAGSKKTWNGPSVTTE
jgi:titin